MKILRFNEEFYPYASIEEELESNIRDIIGNEVETRQAKYSDDIEISSDSIDVAAKKIIDYLKSKGLADALILKKFNV